MALTTVLATLAVRHRQVLGIRSNGVLVRYTNLVEESNRRALRISQWKAHRVYSVRPGRKT